MIDKPREVVVPAPERPHFLVPSRLADAAAGLDVGTVRVYDGGDLPEGAEDTDFWVPPFLAATALPDVIAQLTGLRAVQLLSAGSEQFIGHLGSEVVLCNARGAPSGATAEWVVAAMVASLRGFERTYQAQVEGRWDYRATGELLGKRILIVGAGDVAQAIVRRLAGWEVEVDLVGTRARDGVHGIEELPTLLPDADIVVLIVPITEDTRGMVGADFLATMADGSILLNAARGPVVDTDALIAELTTGRISAVLDVTDPEPLPAGHPLWETPNVMIYPHVAGSVPSTMNRAADLAVTQMRRYVAGEPLQNVVYDY